MIIVKNRKMVVPYDDMYIGTTYDDDSERRIFRIDRYAQNERDLSALTFRLDIKQPGQQADTVILDKDIDERYIYLIWNITNSVIRAAGLMFVQIRAIDSEATVKWSTYDAALYVARHLNTPGSYTGSLTEIEQMEQDFEYMKGVVEELKANIDYAHDAEAWAKGTRSGSAVPSTDDTYHNNSKYYSEQAHTKATAAANSATAAANSATAAAETVADTNTRFNNAMAAVTSETEVIDARVGADGTQHPVLKTRLDTEHTQLKTALQNVSGLFIYEQPSITKDSGLMLLPVAVGDSITIDRIDGQAFLHAVQLRFYDSNGAYVNYMSTIPNTAVSRTWTYNGARDAAYIGITDVEGAAGEYRVINNSSKSLLVAEIKARKSADDTLTNNLGILDEQAAKKDVANRFNPSTITEGVYLNPNTGSLIGGSNFFASDFIYIGDLETVKVSYTHLVIWADENKNWIGHPDNMDSGATKEDQTYTIPENAKYIRFSTYNTRLNVAQVGENISRDHYVSHDVYTLPGLVVDASQVTEGSGVVVAADGSGDYTSFTLAVKENYNNNKPITVMPGTYDIVAEYVAIWGQEAVDSMADADTAIFDGWQYGVRMGGKKFTFVPGAHLVCDWTGHTVDGTHRFSALRVETNVEIIGLDLNCTATFYAIHDDYGTNVPYTVRYENCRVIGHNLVNADCIGGGCKKYSRHILKNCYFDNNLTNSATVRYHNTNAEGAEPEIYVSNCYFNNWFTPRWYGTQTSKMKVYVNNCEARSIHKMAESSSYNVDNVELFKWCNTETDPVT